MTRFLRWWQWLRCSTQRGGIQAALRSQSVCLAWRGIAPAGVVQREVVVVQRRGGRDEGDFWYPEVGLLFCWQRRQRTWACAST